MTIDIAYIEPIITDLSIEPLFEYGFGVFYKEDTLLFRGTYSECEDYIRAGNFPILYA